MSRRGEEDDGETRALVVPLSAFRKSALIAPGKVTPVLVLLCLVMKLPRSLSATASSRSNGNDLIGDFRTLRQYQW